MSVQRTSILEKISYEYIKIVCTSITAIKRGRGVELIAVAIFV